MADRKMTGIQEENTSRKTDRVGIILMLIHFCFLFAAVILVGRILYLQIFYKPDPRVEQIITPSSRKSVTDPERGSILAKDGRLLASSIPMYQIYMDCTVQKEAFAKMRNSEEGKKNEQEWLSNARELSKGLAAVFHDKTAEQYYKSITDGRKNGNKYMKIGHEVNHETLQELKNLPLFNLSSYKGGMIVQKIDTRKYPYGSLARRVIGYVRNNSTSSNNSIGIEGKYNYALHGTAGVEWKKETDARKFIKDFDSTTVKVENGMDVRTTLDIDIQDIADKALRQRIKENDNIEGGCAIVMDVKTGAIRAMVNLKRDSDGEPREIYNYAIGRAGDPGSVMKLATLMTLLEDGKVRLDTMVPTHKGMWTYNKTVFKDDYLPKWPSSEISVMDGFKISSNNVFRQLACEYYDKNPERFIKKLYEYKLTESFDFDLVGLATPVVPSPGSESWSGTALPSIAIGYTVNETPLHIITLYNAVANKGKMMKPYLVESFEENGKVKKHFGPTILNGSICSKATADTLTRALMAVTESGTGKELKNARCKVAGKTGTAQIPFPAKINGKDKVVYKDSNGNRQHQATFVGFFPAENPQYTAIVVLYSKLSGSNLYGSFGIPAFKTIVNEMYALNMIGE